MCFYKKHFKSNFVCFILGFACLGFLSPANRGALMTCVLVQYFLTLSSMWTVFYVDILLCGLSSMWTVFYVDILLCRLSSMWTVSM